jgi:hypothetical protein
MQLVVLASLALNNDLILQALFMQGTVSPSPRSNPWYTTINLSGREGTLELCK